MITLLLGRAADGEGVPLVGGDGRDVQVDVVTRLVVEELRPLDHEVSDLQGTETGKPGASSGNIRLVSHNQRSFCST